MARKIDLQQFLQRVNKSQADLAKDLGTTPGNVNRWAKGDGAPGYDLCVSLLEMGMTTEELFGVTVKQNVVNDDDFEKKVKEIIIKALQK